MNVQFHELRKAAACMAGAVLTTAFAMAPSAEAQSRTLGNTDVAISQALAGYGYAPQFRIIDRELVRTVVEACRGRDMYRVSVNVLGAVKTKERRGRCDIPNVAGNERRRDIVALSPREVRRKLRDEGYSRIEFIDRDLPVYVAEACDQRDRRVRMRLDRRGEVRRSERTRGSCRRTTVADVRKGLQDNGYRDIRFETERAPFNVLACREERLERVVVNRAGRVVSRKREGRCGRRATAETLASALTERGLKRVRVSREGNGFKAIVCDKGARFNLYFDRYGDRTNRQSTGRCTVSTVGEILDTLEKRGAERVNLFVEGCFRNNRYRWSFDELGDRTDRKRIGNC